MTALYNLSEIVTSFIECCILILVYGKFFTRRLGTELHIFLTIVFSVAVTALTIFMNSIELFSLYTTFTWIFACIVCGMILYSSNILKMFCVSILYLVLISAIDLFVLSIIELLFGANGITFTVIFEVGLPRTIYILLVKLILMIFCIFLMRSKSRFEFSNVTGAVLSVYGCLFFAGLQIMVDAVVKDDISAMRRSVLLALVFVILFMIIVFVMLRVSSRLKNEVLENSIITARIEVLENDNRQLNDAYKEIAKMSHDHNNQIRTMSVLAQNEKYDELSSYLNDLNTDIGSIKIKSYTAIDSIDAAINSKVNQAEAKNINIEVSASFPHNIGVRQVDVCTLIVNLLDNAIEACSQADSDSLRNIKLSMFPVGDMIVIKVENPYNRPVTFDDSADGFKTTKSDINLHGYGIKIVKAITEKYNGSLKINYSDNKFTVIAMLSCDN